ncbi:MAG: hypothetical protein RJB66_13 [Pseudomonadota bacterium]
MKKTSKAHLGGKNLQKLSLSVGNFIRYWGFRRIHGAIWTQLYLSNEPLSCTDLTARLGLSKALISPALEELCEYRLIREAPAPNEKTKLYEAVSNINEVIHDILKTRESKMLKQIASDFSSFHQVEAKSEIFNQKRVNELQEMIGSANLMLELMLAQEDLMKLPVEIENKEE